MSAPFVPASASRTAPPQNLDTHDAFLADLLQMLNATARAFDAMFAIDELVALSGKFAEIRADLLATSADSIERVIVRERCQRLLETIACRMLETSNEPSRPTERTYIG